LNQLIIFYLVNFEGIIIFCQYMEKNCAGSGRKEYWKVEWLSKPITRSLYIQYFFCVCIFILYQVFFSCGFCFPILAGRQSSTDRMDFQRCYYYYLFFSGRWIRIFRHPGRSLSTRQDVLAGLVFIFKFIFLLPFTFNNNNNCQAD